MSSLPTSQMREIMRKVRATWAASERARKADDARREHDPVEQAKRFLRRRGEVVFAAHVAGKGEGHLVNRAREPIDDLALIELAVRKGFVPIIGDAA